MTKPGTTGIYEIVNTTNGKRYIGSAKNFDVRWKSHRNKLRKGTHSNRYLQFAWVKYGEGTFEFRTILLCAIDRLVAEEQDAINAQRPEYNLSPTAGSTLGVRFTEETKRKISAALIGKTLGRKRDRAAVKKTAEAHRGMKRPKETGQKISAKLLGKKMPPRSEEHRAKLSAVLKGRPKSPEVMKFLQAGRARHKYTDEQRARVAANIKAQYMNGTRCRDRPPEYREKIAASLRGRRATDEHRANQSAAQRGKKRGSYIARTVSLPPL